MCIKTMKKWFTRSNDGSNEQKNKPARPAPTAVPKSSASAGPLAIPHPEEPPDPNQTMGNTDINATLQKWMSDYDVPTKHRSHWTKSIVITMDDHLPYPAAAYELNGVRHLTIRPEWVNPGVIAHEQAHNSYALMSNVKKSSFSSDYNSIKSTDPLIGYLYSINSYGLTNDIEGHAELYRYLGQQVPAQLKKYYPKLF